MVKNQTTPPTIHSPNWFREKFASSEDFVPDCLGVASKGEVSTGHSFSRFGSAGLAIALACKCMHDQQQKTCSAVCPFLRQLSCSVCKPNNSATPLSVLCHFYTSKKILLFILDSMSISNLFANQFGKEFRFKFNLQMANQTKPLPHTKLIDL